MSVIIFKESNDTSRGTGLTLGLLGRGSNPICNKFVKTYSCSSEMRARSLVRVCLPLLKGTTALQFKVLSSVRCFDFLLLPAFFRVDKLLPYYRTSLAFLLIGPKVN